MSTENGSGGEGQQPPPVAVADLLDGGGGGGAPSVDDGPGSEDTATSAPSAAPAAGNGTTTTTTSNAPETPSEKLTRQFRGLSGTLGGLGANLGRGIRTAVNARDEEYTPTAARAARHAEEMAKVETEKRMDREAVERVQKRLPSGTMNPAMEARTTTSFHRQNSSFSTSSGAGSGSGGSSNPLGALTTSLSALTTSLGDGISTTTEAIGSTVTQTVAGVGTSVSRGLSRQYTMPDRTVASQVLMYRQLLHTECKPGLRLSRAFQGTPAQRAVMHMPWWEQGVEKTKRMVISYDNLIVRLWLSGGIMPYVEGGYAHKFEAAAEAAAPAGAAEPQAEKSSATTSATTATTAATTSADTSHVDTLIDSKGLPPIPHQYWVDRLGFQQTDPVTDFRSGGVLSLAMLVHIVEACPHVHARFLPDGPAHMLPFGITCINITDMLAKFLMFSKSVDRIDALLSQKPFWRMFGDPNSLLVCQELSMDMLADVVVEMVRERRMPGGGGGGAGDGSLHGESEGKVTVFDFAEILDRTEKRVRDDLLGAGPKSVPELRAVHAKLRVRYEKAIARKERDAERKFGRASSDNVLTNNPVTAGAGALLGKIAGGDQGDADKDKPAQMVTAIDEVAFGDSYDEVESSAVPPVAAAAATVASSHSALDVTATPPVEESASPAIQEQSGAADTLAPAPTTVVPPAAAAATAAAPPDLLGGAVPAPTEEEAKLSSDAGDGEFSIGDDDLDEGNILDFLDDAIS
mmetsp:Transcript_17212/g.38082  ORF Transcript_17212/g.38082 Transcript_17212/m.38082 type:complete len:746 (-) Transcript_17212:3144-5381(-)